MTRLEVLDGLVKITKLSDGKSVNVAAGQYAVAADGVELVALALTEGESLDSENGVAQFDSVTSRKSRYGRLLLDDEFDGTLANWDVIVGTKAGESRTLTGDCAPYAVLAKDLSYARNPANASPQTKFGSCLVLDTQGDADKSLTLISKRPIDAERFVVAMRCVFISTKDGKRNAWVNDTAIDAGDGEVTDEMEFSQVVEFGPIVSRHHWEFAPASGRPEILECRVYRNKDSMKRTDGSEFLERGVLSRSYCVRPRSKRIRFELGGSSWRMVIDRIEVREIAAHDVAENRAR